VDLLNGWCEGGGLWLVLERFIFDFFLADLISFNFYIKHNHPIKPYRVSLPDNLLLDMVPFLKIHCLNSTCLCYRFSQSIVDKTACCLKFGLTIIFDIHSFWPCWDYLNILDEMLTRKSSVHKSPFCLQSATHSSIFMFPVSPCLDPQTLQGKNDCNRGHHQYKVEAGSVSKQVGEVTTRNEGMFRSGKSCCVGRLV
jgi:hypothetical protein